MLAGWPGGLRAGPLSGYRSAWWPGCRAGRAGSTGPRVSFPGRRDGLAWSARGEGLEAGDRSDDLAGPWPAPREAQPQAAAPAGDAPGDRGHAPPPPPRLP